MISGNLTGSTIKNIFGTLLILFPIIYAGIFFGGPLYFEKHLIYNSIYLLGVPYILLCMNSFKKAPLSKNTSLLLISIFTFIGFCALQLASSLFGWSFWNGTHYPYGTYRTLTLAGGNLIFFLVLLTHLSSTKRIFFLLKCLVFLIATLSLMGLLQDIIPNVWRKKMFFTTQYDFEFYGNFFNRDFFSFLLNLILPFAMTWTFYNLLNFKKLYVKPGMSVVGSILTSPLCLIVLATLLIAVTTGWTGSRGGTLSIAFTLGITGSALLIYEVSRGGNTVLKLLALISVAAIILIGMLVYTGVPDALRMFYWWFVGIKDILIGERFDGSFDSRLRMYEATLQGIKMHPLAGFGLGTFSAIFPSLKTASSATFVLSHLHNEYLQTIAETGLIGFVFLIGLPAFTLIRTLIFLIQKNKEISQKKFYLLCGLSGGLLAAAIHSLSDFSLVLPVNLFVLLLLAAALLRLQSTSLPQQSDQKAIRKPILTILGIMIWLIFATAFTLPQIARLEAKKGNLEAAIKLDPLNHSYVIRKFSNDLSSDTSQIDSIEDPEIQKVLNLGRVSRVYRHLGWALLKNGKLNLAEQIFRKSVETNPNNPRDLSNMINILILTSEKKIQEKKSVNSEVEGIKTYLARLKSFDDRDHRRKNAIRLALTNLKSEELKKMIEG